MRPHREAFTKHMAPMNPSDNVHKTVLTPDDTKNPKAKANAGRHQKRNIFVPLNNTSRCFGSQALALKVSYPCSCLDVTSRYLDLDRIAILQTEMSS